MNMHKIYSRPRIKIQNIKSSRIKTNKRSGNINNINKINKNKLIIVIIVTIAILTVRTILGAVYPIFDTLCESKAKSIATIISNEEATNVMKEHSYDELFTIEKDSNNNITMIKSNIIKINEITSAIAEKIQKRIDNTEREKIEIAIGSFTGFKLLAGRGPTVKIQISSIGNVETDLRSEFKSQGVNQTLHRLYLEVKCNVNILTPFKDIEKEITNQVLLMENVIVGKIPETYYNFNGTDIKDSAMEVIE